MDDDEDEREFSKSIVYDFFDQAGGTFQKMDKSMQVFPSHLPLFPSVTKAFLLKMPRD